MLLEHPLSELEQRDGLGGVAGVAVVDGLGGAGAREGGDAQWAVAGGERRDAGDSALGVEELPVDVAELGGDLAPNFGAEAVVEIQDGLAAKTGLHHVLTTELVPVGHVILDDSRGGDGGLLVDEVEQCEVLVKLDHAAQVFSPVFPGDADDEVLGRHELGVEALLPERSREDAVVRPARESPNCNLRWLGSGPQNALGKGLNLALESSERTTRGHSRLSSSLRPRRNGI